MIKKYEEYMNEGSGISNCIKIYTDDIFNLYENSIRELEEDYLKEGIEIIDDYNNEDLILMNMCVEIKKGFYNSGLAIPTYSKLKNNILYDYKIEIIYKDLTKLKELITHELTHLKEFYEYCKKINSIEINNKTKIINNSNQIETINFSWIDLKNINNDIRKINTSKEYDKFLFLVYLSLDGEMNSRISQLYNYLYDFGIDDDKIMMNKIIEHQNYIYYLELKNFNHIHMCDKVIDEIGDELFIEITNKFTKKLLSYDILNRIKSLKNIPKNINTLEDTYSFFNIWEKLFTKKCEKHYNKFKHIIKEVSKDLKGLKPFNDAYRNDIDNDFRKW